MPFLPTWYLVRRYDQADPADNHEEPGRDVVVEYVHADLKEGTFRNILNDV